tara:strand:- start:10467 stop:10739 length:273 start_codon:yes stop_codon:yes gene_type:complete
MYNTVDTYAQSENMPTWIAIEAAATYDNLRWLRQMHGREILKMYRACISGYEYNNILLHSYGLMTRAVLRGQTAIVEHFINIGTDLTEKK